MNKEKVGFSNCKGIRTNVLAAIFAFILIFLCCGKKDNHLRNPEKFLETKNFPRYFLNIPSYGVNGKNGLVQFDEGEKITVAGIYVKGRSGSFLRTLSDETFIYYPLAETLAFQAENYMLEVRGTVTTNGEPVLSEVTVLEKENIEEIKNTVEDNIYPQLFDIIKEKVHNPKSKLDLNSIDKWHRAAYDNRYFIYGRIYDLMYEFDIGILLSRNNNVIEIEKIYAREFFKGE